MTIQEAIKSGKPFKRKSWTSGWLVWAVPVGFKKGRYCCSEHGLHFVNIVWSEILADDWEVKE